MIQLNEEFDILTEKSLPESELSAASLSSLTRTDSSSLSDSELSSECFRLLSWLTSFISFPSDRDGT